MKIDFYTQGFLRLMGSTETNIGLLDARTIRHRNSFSKRVAFTLALACLFTLFAASALAQQKRFVQRYPVRQNARLQLTNRFGTITVEAWDRDEIKVSADMDSPLARFTPERTDDSVTINVMRENQGRDDVGDVNFHIYVPVNSIVDVETKRGNITVRNVHGAMVRAYVTSEGNIELTNIHAKSVMAQNTLGDIFFDGELMQGGKYEFKSTQGNMNIRLPADSSFNLMAVVPSREIELGPFSNSGLRFIFDKRKVLGNVGNGGVPFIVFNQRGRMSFLSR
ncbi:MAG: DUF4097 family beta strand repeat-containing protein [Pyrinomonadaceae bacterium]